MDNMRPNILLIHADQHRWDCLEPYGNKDVKTPNIQRLANDGVVYTQSFSTHPVCTPSRYSLLAGLHPHQHLGWGNHNTLPATLDTFPRMLRDIGGYRTKAVGKMHFTPTYLDVGFDHMELAEQHGPGRFDDDYHRYLFEKGLVDKVDVMDQVDQYRNQAPEEYWKSFGAMESNLDNGDDSTSWIGNRAIATLQDWNEGGNLLMMGFIKPHHPMDPPASWSDMYNPDELNLLPGWLENCPEMDLAKHPGFFPHRDLSEETMKKIMAFYYACISQIDYEVGRMIDLLIEKGLYDNTMIIYTSDHGDYMGFHHMVLKQNYMYDPLIKVPLIIKYPHQSRIGEDDGLVSNIDLAPTILQQADCIRPNFMKGLDLSKVDRSRRCVFAEDRMGHDYMARTNTRKLLLCKDNQQSQYFNLVDDPFETINLFNDPEYQDEIDEMRRALADWMLFEAVTPSYLDEYAKIIHAENAVGYDPERRRSSMELMDSLYWKLEK